MIRLFNLLAFILAVWQVYRKQLLGLVAVLIFAAVVLSLSEQPTRLENRLLVNSQESLIPSDQESPTDQLGRRYHSLEELNSAQRAVGFAPVGFFGDNWPGWIDEVLTAKDQIEFVRGDGVVHRYQGFDGRLLKVIRLLSEDRQETLIVYRSDAGY